MKDAFGSTIMIYILIVFLAIYIIFIALTLNYAKAFKIKNRATDIIEQYDGLNSCVAPNRCAETEIRSLLNSYSMIVNNNIFITNIKNNDAANTCYYRVITYIPWEFPFFNIQETWKIKGETKNVKTHCSSTMGVEH